MLNYSARKRESQCRAQLAERVDLSYTRLRSPMRFTSSFGENHCGGTQTFSCTGRRGLAVACRGGVTLNPTIFVKYPRDRDADLAYSVAREEAIERRAGALALTNAPPAAQVGNRELVLRTQQHNTTGEQQ
jgi:hypothetical protein